MNDSVELPALPSPVNSTYTNEGSTRVPWPPGTPFYTADQMREYAQEAVRLAASPAAPQSGKEKTLPQPTRVYILDHCAVVVGTPQKGWGEEGDDAHNCDAEGCSSIGPHVLYTLPVTDERQAAKTSSEARDSDDPHEFGAGIEDNPKAKYWQQRAAFWREKAKALGYGRRWHWYISDPEQPQPDSRGD